MPVSEALMPLCLLLIAGTVLLLLIRHRNTKRGDSSQLPRDPLAELFLDHDDDENG